MRGHFQILLASALIKLEKEQVGEGLEKVWAQEVAPVLHSVTEQVLMEHLLRPGIVQAQGRQLWLRLTGTLPLWIFIVVERDRFQTNEQVQIMYWVGRVP